MAQRKAEGVLFGRTVAEDMLPVYRQIRDLRAAGVSINAISRQLNAGGIPTAKGGAQWYASTVKAVLVSETLARIAA